MSLKFRYCADGNHTGITEDIIIKNSAVVAVGDAIKYEAVATAAGFGLRVTAGQQIRGVVVDIVTNDGLPLDAATTSDYDGTWVTGTKTYTAASDNQTDKKIKARVQISPFAVYSADYSAALATTTGSDKAGHYSDLSDHATVDETSVSDTAAQVFVVGTDPLDSGNMLVMIAEQQGRVV